MKTKFKRQSCYLGVVLAAKKFLAQKWNLNLLFLLASLGVFAQNTGEMKVQVLEKKNHKETIPFTNIAVFKDSVQVASATTDLNGCAIIKSLAAGKYKVKAVFIGYQPEMLSGVFVMAYKTTHLTIYLNNTGVDLKEVAVINYQIDLIDKDTKSGGVVMRSDFQAVQSSTKVVRSEYQKMACKSINSVVSTQAGVYQMDNGSPINIRGGRTGSTNVFIDGERAIGTNNIPQQAVEQISVITGGVPAQYENGNSPVTPGVVNIISAPRPVNKITTPAYNESNTEEYGIFIENGFNSVSGQPLSTFAIDVDAASYSNTRRMISEGVLPPKDAVRIEEFINYFKYNYPKVTGENPFGIFTEYAECPWNKEHKLLQVALKGKDIDDLLSVPNHLVFLIDVSGSMSSEDKLPLLKRALKLLVKQLRPEDKLSIVVYAGSSGKILEAVDGDEKEKIINSLDKLEAGGSTAGGEGIALAYKIAEGHFIKKGNNRIILATDGDFNVGLSSEKELEDLITEKRGLGIYLSVLGFGEGNIKDSKMEILADKGNGNYYYIDNFMEARKVLVSQFGGTMYAIAKDVKIQVEFNPAKVKEYRLIGYDNRLLAAEDFNNDKKDAGELGAGHCVTALYEIIPAGSTESLSKIDELKYLKVCSDENKNELATVKFRYKGIKKEDTVSKLIVKVVDDNFLSSDKVSVNFKLSSGVCEFAMILKDSDFKGNSSFRQAIELVSAARNRDTEGYISELIEMIKSAQEIKPVVASKK